MGDTNQTSTNSPQSGEFSPGAEVVYGLHGRCSVIGIETKTVNGQTISFYKLEPLKLGIQRPKKQDSAIWLPIASAKRNGLRPVMTKEEGERVLNILGNKEYYFSVEESWNTNQSKIDKIIVEEGAIGLAKALSFLFVFRKRHIVPPAEVTRTFENVMKVLVREIAELNTDSIRNVEERIEKLLSKKLTPDN